MPELSATAPDNSADNSAGHSAGDWRRRWLPSVLQAVVIVIGFGALGAFGGWLWHRLWLPAASGIAIDHQWIPQPYLPGAASEFSATGWYVVIGLAAGLLVGLVSGLALDRDELITTAAVLIGGVLAGYLCYRVGMSLSPPDHHVVARTAEDGTRIEAGMILASNRAGLAFPLGGLIGLALTFFSFSKTNRDEPGPDEQPGPSPASASAEPRGSTSQRPDRSVHTPADGPETGPRDTDVV